MPTCPMCAHTFAGGSGCPRCGTPVASIASTDPQDRAANQPTTDPLDPQDRTTNQPTTTADPQDRTTNQPATTADPQDRAANQARSRWFTAGAVMLFLIPIRWGLLQWLVLVGFPYHSLPGPLPFVAYFAPYLVGAIVVTAAAPAAVGFRKTISGAWVAGYLLFMLLDWNVLSSVVYGRLYGIHYLLTFVIDLVTAALMLGWWITLRGRSGPAYLSLIAAGVAYGVIDVVWGFVAQAVNPADPFPPAANLVFVSLGAAVLAGGAWMAARLSRDQPSIRPGFAQPAHLQSPYVQPEYVQPPHPQPAYAQPGYPQPGYPQPGRTNGMAIASLVFGVIGGGVLAVVFGHIARSQIHRTGQAGAGLALAGLVLGYVGVLGAFITIVMMVVYSQY